MGLFNKFIGAVKESMAPTKQTIYDKYYSDYPEKPYISDDRNVSEWLERTEMFPEKNVIPKSIMKRYADGLLPGHVYMLYWLGKYKNKKVPAYFEYKYGINFDKEKLFLTENEYLENDSLTEKGKMAVEKHEIVIIDHKKYNEHNEKVCKSSKHNFKAKPSTDLVDNNLRGINFEKQGDLNNAITLYEYNIQHRFNGNHPYDRLAIIYRKQKLYDKEISVLETAIDVFTNDISDNRSDKTKKLNKFKERIEKAKILKSQQ